MFTPTEKGRSTLLRTQFSPFTSQLYMGLPSLRDPTTVTLSPVVVGVPRVTVAWQLLSALATILAGQLIVTAEPDAVTVTTKLHSPPCDDVTVTGVDPTGKKEPDDGLAVKVPQVPVVVASANVTCAPLVGTPFTSSVVSATALTLLGQSRVQLGGVVLPMPKTGPPPELLSVVISGVVLDTFTSPPCMTPVLLDDV